MWVGITTVPSSVTTFRSASTTAGYPTERRKRRVDEHGVARREAVVAEVGFESVGGDGFVASLHRVSFGHGGRSIENRSVVRT
nr:hypothetical protein [Haladaptatus halobius]